MRRPPRSAGSSLAAMMMLVLVGTVLGLLIAEVVARFAVPSLDFHFPTMRISEKRFTTRAGQTIDGNGVRYAFDADGFRTGDGSATDAGKPAVLFIGDSFTQGFGVGADEAFPAATCDRLRHQGVEVSCLNAGVTGFGTAHELRLLKKLLDRDDLHIAAVVVQVLPNNDLRDNWEDGGFEVDGGRLVVHDPPRIPVVVRLRVALFEESFVRHSHLVKLVANAVINGTGSDPHYDAAAFDLEQHLLAEVVATTRRHGVPVVIVVCATGWELDAVSATPYDDRARLDFVVATVRALEVPWIDSRTVAGSAADYIPNDGHFSTAGHAAMGDALARTLRPLLRK